MNTPEVTGIEINDEDVDNMERYFKENFNYSFINLGEREALKCVTSRDIQAGPGSGKTTLLVAKLAILTSKTTWRGRGICVLSHTNVARNEIGKRLGRHPIAYQILDYPHFTGTIQSFVDQFLALPYLSNVSTAVVEIDNERFAQRVISLKNHFSRAFYWSSLQHVDIGTLRYEGPDLHLGLGDGYLKLGSVTETYKALLEIKRMISAEGIFRFDDMYAFATAYINEFPRVVQAIRKRFPWVFIDEMQDTNQLQEELLHQVFGTGCILQRFGDINQAIFSGESNDAAQSSFPMKGAIDLGDSKRFGPEIGQTASRLTIYPQQLKGVFEKSGKQAIFVFDDDTIQNVLRAYGEFILRQYNNIPNGIVAKVCGFRKSGESDPKYLPFKISDYWPDFDPKISSKSGSPETLIGYISNARHALDETSEVASAYAWVFKGILRFCHIQGLNDIRGQRLTMGRMLNEFYLIENKEQFLRLLADFCLNTDVLSEQNWVNITKELQLILQKAGMPVAKEKSLKFLTWSECPQWNAGPIGIKAKLNSFQYKGVEIDVNTIHSVKGETHTATLILETCLNRTHDIKSLLPYIKGEKDPSTIPKESPLAEHMKRIFVGSTRPREILCLAIHGNHLGEGDGERLSSLGWEIIDLRKPGAQVF